MNQPLRGKAKGAGIAQGGAKQQQVQQHPSKGRPGWTIQQPTSHPAKSANHYDSGAEQRWSVAGEAKGAGVEQAGAERQQVQQHLSKRPSS